MSCKNCLIFAVMSHAKQVFYQKTEFFISKNEKWYFVTKIVLTYCEKKCSSDQENLLKFEAEGREFARFLRSLERFIQTVKGQNNFW